MKKTNKKGGIIYSTNPDFQAFNDDEEEISNIPPAQQQVKVRLDKKQRAGKTVTLIEGLQLDDSGIEDMAKQLKSLCGTGGSAKNREVVIQGDHRDKIVQWFIKKGFSKTKKT